MNQEFNRLVDEILEFHWKNNPIEATYLGIHQYDDQLDRTDPGSRRQYFKKLKEYLSKIDKFSSGKSKLSQDEQMDWKMLQNALKVEITEENKIHWYERLPQTYPEGALLGCYIMLLRDFAPLERRMKCVLGRLKQVPRFINEGKKNLTKGRNIPRIWVQIALEITLSGKEFFKQMIPRFAEKVPRLKKEILTANQKALIAFDGYEKFLKNQILPRAKGQFGIGMEHFEFLLSVHHQLPYTTDDLLSIGSRIVQQTQAEMKEVARKINPRKIWVDIVDDLKKKHPSKTNLVGFYEKEMTRARDFVKKKDLVTIPKGETLAMIETPIFKRNIIPYAAYMAPAPFEKKQEGFF